MLGKSKFKITPINLECPETGEEDSKEPSGLHTRLGSIAGLTDRSAVSQHTGRLLVGPNQTVLVSNNDASHSAIDFTDAKMKLDDTYLSSHREKLMSIDQADPSHPTRMLFHDSEPASPDKRESNFQTAKFKLNECQHPNSEHSNLSSSILSKDQPLESDRKKVRKAVSHMESFGSLTKLDVL